MYMYLLIAKFYITSISIMGWSYYHESTPPTQMGPNGGVILVLDKMRVKGPNKRGVVGVYCYRAQD